MSLICNKSVSDDHLSVVSPKSGFHSLKSDHSDYDRIKGFVSAVDPGRSERS